MKKTSLKVELGALVNAPFEPGIKKVDIQPGITLRRDDHYFCGDEKIIKYYLSFGSFYGCPEAVIYKEIKSREPLYILDEITDVIRKFYDDITVKPINNIFAGYRG